MPTRSEQVRVDAYLQENRKQAMARRAGAARAEAAAWASVCQAIFGCAEFRFIE
jgi:hypothetical protein